MRHARRISRTTLSTLLLVLCAAGCGADDDPAPVKTAATPAASEPEHHPTFEPGHSKAVRRYYGSPHSHDDAGSQGLDLDTEEEYHQPPHPATGGIGDTITLTGTNLGVRMDVTVTGVEAGKRHTTVALKLINTGIAVFESQLTKSFVVDAGGRRARLATGAGAPCSDGLEDVVRLDVGEERTGCLVYPTSRSRPARLQLALEQVPAAAGGRWSLR